MTLPLELGGVQDPDVRRAFEEISKHFPLQPQDFANVLVLLASTGTARKDAFGVDTVTFTASTLSATKNISHGLGALPVSVQLTANSPGFGMVVTARSSTTFTVQGWTGGAVSTTIGFDWRAVG